MLMRTVWMSGAKLVKFKEVGENNHRMEEWCGG